jgi:YidC/Oxa1 family membrane protein insertase
MFENMLDYLRVAVFTLLLILGFFLFQDWQREHPAAKPVEVPVQTNTNPAHYAPAVSDNTSLQPTANAVTPAPVVNAAPSQTGQIINVTTDLLDVGIDTRGGDIVKVSLLKYPESLGSKTPFLLLNNNDKTRYLAESGLLSQRGPDTSQNQALYTAPQLAYSLTPSEKELQVKLFWQKNGIKVTKIFTFVHNSYEIKVGYQIDNQSQQPWDGSLYTQLLRTNTPPETTNGLINLATYFGAAHSSPQKPFEKISFSKMNEKNLNQQNQNGWVAMIQHYFISAWVPPLNSTSTYYTKVTPSKLYTVGMIGPTLNVLPGNSLYTESKFYAGPAIADDLEKTAPALRLTIDYGWFWFISDIIFWMMQKIHDVIGNWGWSIVLVTVVIKLLFYQLSAKSYRSMSGLKKLQPKIEELKQRFGEDKQKLTQATLQLYRQEKVNPMSGCLPIVVQIPVFIALYWVLVESVQLRQAPFIFWIHDLSQQDPYYILPLLMGASMFLQQRLSPPPPDPVQAKVMMLMPIIFTFLFANFPAGLMLYWFVNNTLSFLQQWYIMHRVTKEANAKK